MSVDTAVPSAAAASMPEEVVVARDRKGLRIVWPDGRDAALAASALRAACRCAWCTRDRILDRFRTEDAVELRAVEALGSHGLHITFSDGHERGIYPWLYLDELAHGRERDGRGRDSRGRDLEPTLRLGAH